MKATLRYLEGVFIVTLLVSSCVLPAKNGTQTQTKPIEEEKVELATYMAQLQRFSDKLGYSINNKNDKLSQFYLAEVIEVLSEMKEKVPEDGGIPIANTTNVIINPLLDELKLKLDQKNWQQAKGSYLNLIEGCNRCHSATEHEFIIITPARGKPRYNQKFRGKQN